MRAIRLHRAAAIRITHVLIIPVVFKGALRFHRIGHLCDIALAVLTPESIHLNAHAGVRAVAIIRKFSGIMIEVLAVVFMRAALREHAAIGALVLALAHVLFFDRLVLALHVKTAAAVRAIVHVYRSIADRMLLLIHVGIHCARPYLFLLHSILVRAGAVVSQSAVALAAQIEVVVFNQALLALKLHRREHPAAVGALVDFHHTRIHSSMRAVVVVGPAAFALSPPINTLLLIRRMGALLRQRAQAHQHQAHEYRLDPQTILLVHALPFFLHEIHDFPDCNI